MIVYIYRIYFPSSNKCYIGQTKDVLLRLRRHVSNIEDSLVGRAVGKYIDNWEFEILHKCESRDEANKKEVEEIQNHNSISPNGYNLTSGGEVGKEYSEKTKKKMSDIRRATGIKQRDATVSGMVNKLFNQLYVVKFLPEISQGPMDKYLCRCSCGTEKIQSGVDLRAGRVRSCGCLQRGLGAKKRATIVSKMVGKTFGRLEVLEYLPDLSDRNHDRYLCRCICGNEKVISGKQIRSGQTKSCGCWHKECAARQGKASRGSTHKRSKDSTDRSVATKRRNHAKKLELQDRNVMSNVQQLSSSDFEDLII